MGDDIEINVTETTNIIEITPQPNDQIVDIAVTDNAPNVEINVTPSVVEINVTRGSSTAIWGSIEGNLTDQSDLVTALGLKADLIDGKVPSTQLPSYVDDVIEVANYAALPTSGEVGKIYVTLDNNKIYRWSGSLYIEIAANQAIWGAITGNLGDQLDLQNALNTKEPTITAGTTSQYWRGDKSWQTLDKNAVGLGNVDNTSDLNKPISTATQTALDLKFNNPTGDTTQYIAGDGSLITFPISGQAGTIVREVRNTTGATLTKGTIVYISGATGNKATISKAIATGDSTSAQTFGLLQADISNNANGYVVVLGDLIGLDTSGITEGSQLYLSSTVAGAYTTTKQVAPAHLVYIGVVTRSHPSLGQIEVKIQNGYELDEIHDVSITSKANNQFLVYESASNLWKNKSLSTILGGTSSQFLKGDGSLDSTAYVPTARTLTINGTSYDLSANRSWTITAGVWGQITGILSDQTDLQTALDAKTPTARTLTINGTAYDLSANRSWTIPTHDAVTIGTANGLSLSTQVLSLGLSSASANGALSSTDWTTFNNKQGALTFTSPLVNTSGTVSIPAATSTVNGHLTSADWTTFNNKQGALNGTGFVKISGTTISYDNSTYALDSVVVKLTGTQTIDGSKTFLADAYLDNNIYLKKTGSWANPANYSVIGGMTHGFFLSSATNKHAYLDLFQLTQARQYDFPNKSGTFAMTSDVPTVSGDANYIPKFTAASTLGNSLISEGAGQININGALLVKNTSNYNGIIVDNSNSATIGGGYIALNSFNARRGLLAVAGAISGTTDNNLGIFAESGSGMGAIKYYVNGSGTASHIMHSNGNLTIGTVTDAGYKLDVNGTLRVSQVIRSLSTSNAGIEFGNSGSGGEFGFLKWDNASNYLYLGHSYGGVFNKNIVINNSGRVGIGTISPLAKLHVDEDITYGVYGPNRASIVVNNSATDGKAGFISLVGYSGNASSPYGWGGISGGKMTAVGNGEYGGYLNFWTTSNGENGQAASGSYERMRITSGGNVGIGTLSPSFKLQVEDSSTPTVAVFKGGGAGTYSTFNIMTLGANGDGYWRAPIIGSNIKMVSNAPAINATGFSASAIAFGADANQGRIGFFTTSSNTGDALLTESLRINTTGNVLINTTTDAGYKLDVNGTCRIQNNLRVNGGADGSYFKGGDTGVGSGIANFVDYNGVSAMFVRGDRKVGIGTTTPGYLLDVSGGSAFRDTLRMVASGVDAAYLSWTGSNTGVLTLMHSGSVGTQILASGGSTFNGTVTATGFFNSSDIRLKDVIDYDYNVSEIKPMNYYWKDKRDDKKHVGYSAQEVQKVMPDAVNEDENGMLSVNYIEVLVAKIAQMENRIKQLENGLE